MTDNQKQTVELPSRTTIARAMFDAHSPMGDFLSHDKKHIQWKWDTHRDKYLKMADAVISLLGADLSPKPQGQITRYNFRIDTEVIPFVKAVENKDGAWVKYSDLAALSPAKPDALEAIDGLDDALKRVNMKGSDAALAYSVSAEIADEQRISDWKLILNAAVKHAALINSDATQGREVEG